MAYSLNKSTICLGIILLLLLMSASAAADCNHPYSAIRNEAVVTGYSVESSDFHRINTHVTYTCALCGQIVEEANDSSITEPHTFDQNGCCIYCGYYKAGNSGSNSDQSNSKRNDSLFRGQSVRFGHYEQDNNHSNGSEQIEWFVLDVQGSKALLISKYGLDAKAFNSNREDYRWENSTLRDWLNNGFIMQAFAAAEQKAILVTNVDNSRTQGNGKWIQRDGPTTQDKIFLLSYREAEMYLGTLIGSTSPTLHAQQSGAFTSKKFKTAEGRDAGWWWLRSPGAYADDAAEVGADGQLTFACVTYRAGCVRPAIWVDLNQWNFD